MKFQNPSMHGSKIWHASDVIRFFQRGITPEREITWTRKKTCSGIFP